MLRALRCNRSEVVHAPRTNPLTPFERLHVRARRHVLGTHDGHGRTLAHLFGWRSGALLDSEHALPVTRHMSNTNRQPQPTRAGR